MKTLWDFFSFQTYLGSNMPTRDLPNTSLTEEEIKELIELNQSHFQNSIFHFEDKEEK